MKTRCSFFALIFLVMCMHLHAQWEKPQYKPDKNQKNIHGRAGIGLGCSLYPDQYPITDITCRVVILHSKYLVDARLRAYGIASIFNGKNYDLTAYIHRVRSLKTHLTYFYGAGVEATLRTKSEDSIQGKSGVQPMILFGSMYYKEKFYFNVPVWVKSDLDGLSLSVLPEPSYKVGEKVQVFLRYQLSFFTLYNGTGHGWTQDAVLGVYGYF